jgi:hypothetical protein
MKLGWQAEKWLKKKAKQGFRGYPAGTIAFYGPDDTRASKVAVSIVEDDHTEPTEIHRWFAETGDLRKDAAISAEIVEFLKFHGVHTVGMTSGILGCPHEEGVDYPDGEACPQCPFWAGRDRWANFKPGV